MGDKRKVEQSREKAIYSSIFRIIEVIIEREIAISRACADFLRALTHSTKKRLFMDITGPACDSICIQK